MITRVYLKNCLSFDEVDLEFKSGLNIFTGPSGAGKSILMQEILSLFALTEVKADIGEVNLNNSKICDEVYDISFEEDIVIKSIKKDKTRYFLNNQTISKKNLYDFSTKLIKHLNLRDTSEFDSVKLVGFLDRLCSEKNSNFIQIKNSFDNLYKDFIQTKKELDKIIEDETKLEDLKEFVKFEIDKIEQINPKVDEYEELNEIKKRLAKKEKIEVAINKASGILEFNQSVNNVLELMEVDSSFFDETMNELNNIFEKFNDSLIELDDINIENVLDRIEKLSSLQKRFGSIKECLEYKEQKIKELESYENISFQKENLEKKYENLHKEIKELSQKISTFRKENSKILEEKINQYLQFLYLSNAKIIFEEKSLDSTGIDEIKFQLNQVALETISSGEYNRLRLALLTSMSELDIGENGILFLDEIDANLSGKESEAIAKVLVKLSSSYQIFAISHQTQLTSSANQHFLVDKQNGKSSVKLLNKEEKINEIARMISGEKVTSEALEFAKNLLNN
ncbi:AAA family ATPase [Aliarcobacter butzleri]|uniref:AAA family ATPase n=1 Tax=Aliarcobacter butzleri TaxID=28197 RepID=UPI001EE09D2B|nr:AAA family ATPase [Aliarcobacter butzleri]MCG3698036.1 DNA recombination protein RecN [Aliarcobacter butzleri]MCG3700020.1 DNA recombination protein RecN [Aliarcobacter butzleri]MCT7537864.1 DNA recombination protein RecN [Aliarcobacter butzleri]MCT7584322.1 DNA recombination protein RecN [Aliarcobacter butzleri]MCT7624562.1 DNA recombination protein RecN [Aliarcobacter butzleri]